jgi:signal transduction histidine kinase
LAVPKKQIASRATDVSLDDLAAGLAHAILNPLAGLAGAIDLLTEELPKDHPRRELLRQMRAEAERVEQAVSGLTQYARPKAVEPVAADLNPTALRGAELARRQAPQSGVNIGVRPCAELTRVPHDAMRMAEALAALLAAAVRVSPDSSSVELRLSRQGPWAVMEITDCGPRLEAAELAILFQPFGGGGRQAGMALALAALTVRLHEGKIQARNASASRGTVVSVHLPLGAAG